MDLLRLEQQRAELEHNLQKLRASLRHWQTWSAEYEGFKEELETSPHANIVQTSKTYDGELVNEKEIRDLAGLDGPSPRTTSTILGMISRRQEYVQRNIDTIQRQFWDAEAKLEELDFASFSATRNSSNSTGLPITEIHEELDEDGNVVSSSLSRPEDATVNIVNALRKAGVAESDLHGSSSTDADQADKDDEPATEAGAMLPRPAIVNLEKRTKTISHLHTNGDHAADDIDGPSRPPIRKKSVSFTVDTKPPPEPSRQDSEDGRKSVSFNEKVSVMPAAPPPDNRSVSFSPQVEEIPADSAPAVNDGKHDTTSESQKELRTMFKPGEKVYEFNDDEELTDTHVVYPEGESEEDARIRREMLEYHLNEVGHVVAQMDIDEDDYDLDGYETASASEVTSSERLDEDTPYTSGMSESENESEDEYGRTKHRVISDDYHKEMQALQQRLIGNLGPAPDDRDVAAIDEELDPQHVRKLVVREKRNSASSMSSDGEKKTGSKKRVSFAEVLDVAEEPATKVAKRDGENVVPVADSVLERPSGASAATPEASAPSTLKTSKFKKVRAVPFTSTANSCDSVMDTGTPSGPAGKIIADTLLERTTKPCNNVAAPSEDEPSEIMQRRELAAEYYRRRNDLVRQQGGFKASADEDQDDEDGPLMEERDGKLKKVSRFKAARIKPA